MVAPGNRKDLEDEFCGDYYTDGVFFPLSGTHIKHIRDGTSSTLAIGERVYYTKGVMAWTDGAYWVTSPDTRMCVPPAKNVRFPINANKGYRCDPEYPPGPDKIMLINDLVFGSWHRGGANFAYADGSVHFLFDTIDFTIYQDLATIDGGEVNRWNP